VQGPEFDPSTKKDKKKKKKKKPSLSLVKGKSTPKAVLPNYCENQTLWKICGLTNLMQY
jgi:hypothetical protein